MCRISVIVPVYNTQNYLPLCIDSILAQEFTDFELLLVDDGSTDNSGKICDEYAESDHRIKVFHGDNSGATAARNRGLDAARGEWITFIDSDDTIHPDYFPLEYNSSLELYLTNWHYLGQGINDFIEPQVVQGDEFRAFLEGNIHRHWLRTVCGSFFKRNIITEQRIRFDTSYRLGEDTLFAMKYYKACNSLQVLDHSVYCYNREDNWGSKYQLTWTEAQSYLVAFMKCYDELDLDCPKLLDFMFPFIYKSIDVNESKINVKWSISKPVLQYKRKQFPEKDTRFKVKYYIKKALSYIVCV